MALRLTDSARLLLIAKLQYTGLQCRTSMSKSRLGTLVIGFFCAAAASLDSRDVSGLASGAGPRKKCMGLRSLMVYTCIRTRSYERTASLHMVLPRDCQACIHRGPFHSGRPELAFRNTGSTLVCRCPAEPLSRASHSSDVRHHAQKYLIAIAWPGHLRCWSSRACCNEVFRSL